MATVWIYESELRAIAAETLAWTTETGGSLFGFWRPEPTILLASGAGPCANRSSVQCRFDLEFLERLGTRLAIDWRLQFFGDWHSHVQSGATFPSSKDRDRIGHVFRRNGFLELIELIVARPPDALAVPDGIHISAYSYKSEQWNSPEVSGIGMMPGISPIRDILTRRDFETGLNPRAWETPPYPKISGVDSFPRPEPNRVTAVRDVVERRAFAELIRALSDFSGEPVEDRYGPAGRELWTRSETQAVGLVFEAECPFTLLKMLVSSSGIFERRVVLNAIEGINALLPDSVIRVYAAANNPPHPVVDTDVIDMDH
jgi:hypothetical protein